MYKKDLFSENYIIKENKTVCEEGLYVADFETSNVNNIDNDVFVYATGLMNVNDDSNICIHNNNIHDFINNISNLPEIESKIYFHNLSFDTVFCLLELFEKGFSLSSEIIMLSPLLSSNKLDSKKIPELVIFTSSITFSSVCSIGLSTFNKSSNVTP